ncbi:hypothetical protein [Enterococcus gallinarum]|uniref:hypothetical protein n=1 Tax=Enterococcus gallinarum TaxID=1353 RepID=UPI0015C55313|nr:hypothetical protein [Enterococcus gallinarum]NQE01821.1 hypothetical protein [Enterococcus gallinarum]
MINEKIQMMVKELQKECEKEEVAVLCTLHKGINTTTMLVGDLADASACLAIQEVELNKQLPLPATYLRDTGLVALNKLDKQAEKDKPNHAFIIDDLNDLPEILKSILRGDFK